MSVSSSSSSCVNPISARSKAKCACGVPLWIYTAHTPRNSGRRFLRCRNWQIVGASCGFFFWIDDPLNQAVPHLQGDTVSINSEVGNSQNPAAEQLVDTIRKMKKLKKKAEAERYQKHLACGFAVLSWLLTVLWVICVGRV